VEEGLMPNMPKPQRHPMIMSSFVDTNHAGDVIRRCSHRGMICSYLYRKPQSYGF
jgi:hypothetical protein